MNAVALSSTSSISTLYFLFMSICFFDFFNKGVIQKVCLWWRGGRAFIKNIQKGTGGGGQAYLYVHYVKKNCLIFQTE